MTIPALIYAGDTVKWNQPATDLYSSAVWTRTVALRHPSDASALNVVGVPTNGGWDFTITALQSKTLGAGLVYWQDTVSLNSDRFTIGTGTLTVQANIPATATTFDGRSQAQQDLDALRAEMRARVSGGSVQAYNIGNRSLTKMPMPDLIALESKLKADIITENRRKRIAEGLDSGTAVYIRFGR